MQSWDQLGTLSYNPMLYTNCWLLPDFIGILFQAQQGLILVKEYGCNIPIRKRYSLALS